VWSFGACIEALFFVSEKNGDEAMLQELSKFTELNDDLMQLFSQYYDQNISDRIKILESNILGVD
jgi:inorganic triphosphatase YgiF